MNSLRIKFEFENNLKDELLTTTVYLFIIVLY